MEKGCTYLGERLYNPDGVTGQGSQSGRLKKILPEKTWTLLKDDYAELIDPVLSGTAYEEKKVICEQLLEVYEKKEFLNRDIDITFLEQVNFREFYIPYLKLAALWLSVCHADADSWNENLLNSYLNDILRSLDHKCIRTLIVEMHYANNCGLLRGETPDDKYLDFVARYLADPVNIKNLFCAYPVIERIILACIEMTADNFIKIYMEFQKDEELIRTAVPLQDGAVITGIHRMGDPHADGCFTARISLDDKSILMYKPRSSRIDWIFHDIVSSYYEAAGLSGYMPAFIECGNHSWCGYIEYGECSSIDEVERYYTRLGINLFAGHLLGITDLHFENIIVCGEYPVLIDLEVINGLIDGPEGDEVNSVSDIGILPVLIKNKEGDGINVGALNELERQKFPFKTAHILHPYTSERRIVYKYGDMETDKSIVRMNGRIVGMEKYAGFIVGGFVNAYTHYLEQKKELAERYSEMLAYTECRYLIRNTQTYSQVLQSSYWPELLMDGAYRNLFLYSIMNIESGRGHTGQLCGAEIEFMLKDTIPYFQVNTSSAELYAAADRIPGFFRDMPLNLWKRRFTQLSKPDMKVQRKTIQDSLITAADEAEAVYITDYTDTIGPGLGKYVEAIRLIADEVVNINRKAARDTERDLYLYNGLAGMMMFFAAANAATDGAYRDIYSIYEEQICSYTKRVFDDITLVQSRRTGIFNGESSIVYLYQVLYVMTEEQRYLDLAAMHSEVVEQLIPEDVCYDVMAGNTGAVLAFINQYNLTGIKKYAAWAERAAGHLEANACRSECGIGWKANDMEPLAGFSHGNSGVILALTRLYKVTEKEKYLQMLRDALRYENSLFDEEMCNWADRRSRKVEHDAVSWCHGAPGILLSRKEAALLADREISRIAGCDIKRAVCKIMDTPLKKNMCLCHGNLGNMMILQGAGYSRQCEDYITKVVDDIYSRRTVFPEYESSSTSLMTGLAGAGYMLAGTAAENKFPNILNISVTVKRSKTVQMGRM